MMAATREWLTSVVAVSLLLAAAQSLVPEGSIKRIASFTGGLALLLILLRPLGAMGEYAGLSLDFERVSREIDARVEELQGEENTLLAEGIASRTAAYIWDKAVSLGVSVEVSVETAPGEDGVPIPWAAEVTGPRSEELAVYMERELGIPRERQVWHEEQS